MSEIKPVLTIADAKQAKRELEREIARLLQEFGNLHQCAVNSVSIRNAIWGADEDRPLAYHVEIDATF